MGLYQGGTDGLDDRAGTGAPAVDDRYEGSQIVSRGHSIELKADCAQGDRSIRAQGSVWLAREQMQVQERPVSRKETRQPAEEGGSEDGGIHHWFAPAEYLVVWVVDVDVECAHAEVEQVRDMAGNLHWSASGSEE